MADLPRVRTWADALIRMHLDPSWTFAFDNAKTRAGLCNFTAKRISVSRYIAQRSEDGSGEELGERIRGEEQSDGQSVPSQGAGDGGQDRA